MSEAFGLGGWGMYPTTIVGLILVYCALRYAVTPDASRALLVRRLSTLTFFVGCLGFVAGLIKSFTAIPPNETTAYIPVVVGIGESMMNIGLALVMLVISGIAMATGTARRGATAGPELTDPHT